MFYSDTDSVLLDLSTINQLSGDVCYYARLPLREHSDRASDMIYSTTNYMKILETPQVNIDDEMPVLLIEK